MTSRFLLLAGLLTLLTSCASPSHAPPPHKVIVAPRRIPPRSLHRRPVPVPMRRIPKN